MNEYMAAKVSVHGKDYVFITVDGFVKYIVVGLTIKSVTGHMTLTRLLQVLI